MKILYVITGLGRGGAERVVCDLADIMHTKGHTVKIAYLTGDALTIPISGSIEVIPINLTSLTQLPHSYLYLSKLIKSYKPDIVHAHMVHANLLTRLIRVTTPIPKLICTAHSSNEGNSIRMAAYRLTHKLSNLTTNVSNTAVRSFENRYAVPIGGMKTVYNGVSFEKFKYDPLAKNKLLEELNLNIQYKLILAVGRFSYPKNYPNLIQSIKILKDKGVLNFKLLIAGDGELFSQIKELISCLDLDNDIVLLGHRNDISHLMSAADVFVLSSTYEGLPTVLIEALACQCHIVSTDVSGVQEILGDFGKIVPINDPSALAYALSEALNYQDKNLGGRNFAKHEFDIEAVSEKWLSLYYAS